MLMMLVLKLFASILIADNIRVTVCLILNWQPTKVQLLSLQMMVYLLKMIGRGFRKYRIVSKLKILSVLGNLELDSILSTMLLVCTR